MESGSGGYGVLFLDDNSFIVDQIYEEREPEKPAFWYRKIHPTEKELIRGRCRLTTWIDRVLDRESKKEKNLVAPEVSGR